VPPRPESWTGGVFLTKIFFGRKVDRFEIVREQLKQGTGGTVHQFHQDVADEALQKVDKLLPMVEGLEAAKRKLSIELSDEIHGLLLKLPSGFCSTQVHFQSQPHVRRVYYLGRVEEDRLHSIGFTLFGNIGVFVEFQDVDREDWEVCTQRSAATNLVHLLGVYETRKVVERIRQDLSAYQARQA
jgi:hypothetical protein